MSAAGLTLPVAARKVASRAALLRVAAVGLSVGVTALVLAAFGVDPASGLKTLVLDAVGSKVELASTIAVAAPLILMGLAAAIPFSAKLWNIGGTGQLYAGAIVAAVIGLNTTTWPSGVVVALCIVGGSAGGSIWALIPGLLKAFRGTNEVIISLLLNFVGTIASEYVITLYGSGLASSTSPIRSSVTLPSFLPSIGIDLGVVLSVLVAVVLGFAAKYSLAGLVVRSAGSNGNATTALGFSKRKIILGAFGAGGACAGLAGAVMVLGATHSLVNGMENNYGLVGVGVALVGALSPLLIIPTACVFAVLSVGATSLAVTTNIPSQMSLIVEGLFVISLMSFRVIKLRFGSA